LARPGAIEVHISLIQVGQLVVPRLAAVRLDVIGDGGAGELAAVDAEFAERVFEQLIATPR
jgi:hypothetical protein